MSTSANVFISHHHADSGIADALSDAIEALFKDKVSVSYSTKRADGGIPTGADWFRWIGEQVTRSRVTVLLLTRQFVGSPYWLLWEAGAVYGTALGNGSHQGRVRPLGYRVDGAALPAPLKAANLQVTQGDDTEQMHQFFSGLIDEFDGLTRAEVRDAGARLQSVVASHVPRVGELLNAPPDSTEPPGPPPNPEALTRALELAITAMQAFYPSVRINGRYFYATVESGRELLVRDGSVYVETISMPEEFGLSRIDVERNAGTIVICQSYLQRTPLYSVLGHELMAQYPEDIRPHISPEQGWVLACPVLVANSSPSGVIALYGKKPPARNDEDKRRLLKVAVCLSEVFGRTLNTSGSRYER